MPDFLNVDEVLAHLDLKDTMTGAEFGCGSALFTIALSKKLAQGKVYAMDIQEEKLSALKGRIIHEGINNITLMLCDLEAKDGSTLPAGSLDAVVIPNVLFQAEHKSAILSEGARILKKGGQLLVVDWLKKTSFSPKSGMISPEEMKKMAEALGFALKKEFAAGDYHYALLFIKN
jgi:ubiquinone/menaquinone biosynthesis C-methylase UbiE